MQEEERRRGERQAGMPVLQKREKYAERHTGLAALAAGSSTPAPTRTVDEA
jgi:hypothetical protein